MAVDAVSKIEERGDDPVLVSQVLIEFWAVVTRPENVNGFGWSTQQAEREIFHLIRRFQVLTEPATIFSSWFELATKYGVSDRRAHDTRLVAIMKELGIRHLVTFNTDDFKSFLEISAIHPSDV